MRHLFLIANIGIVALFLSSIEMRHVSAQTSAAAAKTVWDGVYLSAQANRGQDSYDKKCASCHQDDLTGGGDEGAAVLRGADFFAQWNNKTVGDLYRAISLGMPKDAPGSLSPEAAADLVSFLLKKNQIPASDTP